MPGGEAPAGRGLVVFVAAPPVAGARRVEDEDERGTVRRERRPFDPVRLRGVPRRLAQLLAPAQLDEHEPGLALVVPGNGRAGTAGRDAYAVEPAEPAPDPVLGPQVAPGPRANLETPLGLRLEWRHESAAPLRLE